MMDPDSDNNDALDEVGLRLGPDGEDDGEGLFDSPREASAVGEKTSVAHKEGSEQDNRAELLQRLRESVGTTSHVPESGEPCRALRLRIADEPPDLLPALGAPALLHRAGTRVLRPPPPAPPRPSDPDDTNTQIRPMPRPRDDDPPTGERTAPGDTEHTQTGQTGSWLATDRTLRLARWLALGLLSVSAVAWWLLGR